MRYLSWLKQTIKDKIGVHTVFGVQEARNMTMKVELLAIFYLGILCSMMWMLSTRIEVTCIN